MTKRKTKKPGKITPKVSSKLTPKQEAFAIAYIELGSASEAYRKAYEVSADVKPHTAYSEGYKLKSHPEIALRIAELRKQVADSKMIGLEDLVEMLKTNWEHAGIADNPIGASDIAMKMATLLGLNVEKKKVEVDDGPNRTAASATDRARALELLGKLGVAIPTAAGGAGAPGAGASEFPILRANDRSPRRPN